MVYLVWFKWFLIVTFYLVALVLALPLVALLYRLHPYHFTSYARRAVSDLTDNAERDIAKIDAQLYPAPLKDAHVMIVAVLLLAASCWAYWFTAGA